MLLVQRNCCSQWVNNWITRKAPWGSLSPICTCGWNCT